MLGGNRPAVRPGRLPAEASADDVRRALVSRNRRGRPSPRRAARVRARPSQSRSASAGRRCARPSGCCATKESCGGCPGGAAGPSSAGRRSRGTFPGIVGLPAMLRSQGVTAGTRVLTAGLEAADETVAEELGLVPGAIVVSVVRIRLADGSPISVEHVTLPADRFPGLLELPLGGSVYELLEEHYGTRPGEAVERIDVVPASAEESADPGRARWSAAAVDHAQHRRRSRGPDRVLPRPVLGRAHPYRGAKSGQGRDDTSRPCARPHRRAAVASPRSGWDACRQRRQAARSGARRGEGETAR